MEAYNSTYLIELYTLDILGKKYSSVPFDLYKDDILAIYRVNNRYTLVVC